MIKYSLVIPCFNELENIKILIKQIKESNIKDDFELIIVNNGSTDQTNQFISNALDSFPFIKYIHIKKNIGYGHGIIEGLNAAEGIFIGWTHADLQTDILDGLKGFEYFQNTKNKEKLFVKGLRERRQKGDEFFTVCMSIISSIFLRKCFWDINAQPNLFHKSFLKYWNNPPFDFSLDLYVYNKVKSQKLNIIRLPVRFKDRIFGKSKWNTNLFSKIRFIKRNLIYIFKLSVQINS